MHDVHSMYMVIFYLLYAKRTFETHREEISLFCLPLTPGLAYHLEDN